MEGVFLSLNNLQNKTLQKKNMDTHAAVKIH